MAFGPNNLLSVGNGARYGASSAVLAAGGRLLAFTLMIAVAGIGMGALLMASEFAFGMLKWIGAAYLIWIGIRLLRSPALQDDDADTLRPSTPPRLITLARQEFTVAIGNPKAILVFTAFFPQFIAPDAYATSYVLLGATFLLLEVVAITLYAQLGTHMRGLARNGRKMRWFNRVSGSMMIGFGVLLAAARRPT